MRSINARKKESKQAFKMSCLHMLKSISCRACLFPAGRWPAAGSNWREMQSNISIAWACRRSKHSWQVAAIKQIQENKQQNQMKSVLVNFLHIIFMQGADSFQMEGASVTNTDPRKKVDNSKSKKISQTAQHSQLTTYRCEQYQQMKNIKRQ